MATFYKSFGWSDNFLAPLEFTSCLGQGSFGVVLKAVDKSGKPTAVKFQFPSEGTEKQQEQILRECQLAADCDHVNVVKTIMVVTEKLSARDVDKIFKNVTGDEKCNSLRYAFIGKATLLKTVEAVCIQMELCGENLRLWLSQGLDGNEEFVQLTQRTIVRNIIEGLKYIHDKKILHRDLKPENVMFFRAGYQLPVKIGDFGLCRKIRSDVSNLTSRMGTTDYMAPEVYTNSYSFQADLYSLGLVIWEVVQVTPFKNKRNIFERLVIDKEEDLVVEHPHIYGIREIIIGLTKRNVNDRFKGINNVLEITERWEEFTARNSDELKFCLQNVTKGGTIRLVECEYVGEFHLKQDNVKICGVEGSVLKLEGDKTVCLTIESDGCNVSNVAVVTEINSRRIGFLLLGSKNEIRNVKFMCSLYSSDDENHLQNLNISNSSFVIEINGCKNIVEGVDIENVRRGILIMSKSNENSLSNICGRNVRNGIMVYGSHNNISNVNLIKNSTESNFCGLFSYDNISENNRIKNLTCSGYERSKDDWGLIIWSPHCSVENSECGPVWVDCSMNATLTNTDCGELIKVESAGVRLIKCRGKKLQASNEVTLTDCNFDSQISP